MLLSCRYLVACVTLAANAIPFFAYPLPFYVCTYVCMNECIAVVTAICWGISYLFIRRGMNPDTRSRFLQKYWKDAVYGSLAGFNAAFLKQVLKNLIPQEAVEAQMAELVSQRQLRFLSWLPSFE